LGRFGDCGTEHAHDEFFRIQFRDVDLRSVRVSGVYERLCFRITHEDARRFYMKLEPDIAVPRSN
jgi:hypothetical protein